MEMIKSQWTSDEQNLHLHMPLTKIDTENRLVSGYATLDNVDSQGDVVLAEASKNAFARFRGNIREMHDDKKAAGRLIDFKEDSFYEPDTQKFYQGVFVTAYVSKGAQDTWEKVLDGTLTGFSIGGSIIKSENQWVKDADANIRFIKDYELIELSLVDNPANQLANVFSVTKSSEGSVIKGMIAETVVENIFWCKQHEVAKTTTEDSTECSLCGKGMENIGWFEQGDDPTEKVRETVTKYLSKNKDNEGGVTNVAEDETTETPPTEVSEKELNVSVNVEEKDEVANEEAAPVNEEVNTDEPDIQKMFGDLETAVKTSLENNESLTTKAVTKVEEQIAAVNKSFEEQTSEFTKKYEELNEKLDAIKNSSGDVAKRLAALEDETAVRKSGDLPEPVRKSTDTKNWKGAFLSVDELSR